ncbi:MAG: glutamate racemase [Bacteroidetes bacterium]|nr:glutamate racemase [Bacteroidota bacterium]
MNSPIGIFDSGIGGLTVARAIHKQLPYLPIIYFGDTAHLPYGDKSSESIQNYAQRISSFLLKKRCRIIVIACNTASAVAYEKVKRHIGMKAIVFNVIDPVVDYVACNFKRGRVGVIGTKGTIQSRIYVRKIAKVNSAIRVSSLATPLLAPMIEEGYFNNYISRTIIHSYLSKKTLSGTRALILGCTHYPLIKKEVEKFYGKGVDIIDSADIVAAHIKDKIGNLYSFSKRKQPERHFFVSDYTEAFEKSAAIFFGKNIKLKKVNLWR